jgi:glycogen synthase kinase 3 beta
MDYYSDNLYQVIKKKELGPTLMKLYSYQIFRALNYLAMISIAHRDMKPQNILVDQFKHKAIICDFGSAKKLVKSNNFKYFQPKLI